MDCTWNLAADQGVNVFLGAHETAKVKSENGATLHLRDDRPNTVKPDEKASFSTGNTFYCTLTGLCRAAERRDDGRRGNGRRRAAGRSARGPGARSLMRRDTDMRRLGFLAVAVLMACVARAETNLTATVRERVVVVAAHPDDVGSCLGFVLRARGKFDFHLVDFTAGEAGKSGKGVRIAEEETVCREVGLRLHWLGERDGDSYAGREACEKLTRILKDVQPRAVIAHWPVESHTDHLMSAATAMRAVKKSGLRPEIYFMYAGQESRNFQPTHFVDVSEVESEKLRLCRLYASQNRNDWLARAFELENRHWGSMAFPGVRYAEAFARFGGALQGAPCIFSELPKTESAGKFY